MPDPTVVVARLDNKELKESINQMVIDFENGLNRMKQSADTAVADLQKTLKKLSDTKVDSSGSADGGSSRRKKSNDEETQSIKSKTAAAKEFTATLDQQAQAVQKAMGGSRNADIIQTMQTQLELMLSRLREARSQYSSFIELAAHATTTGDKGLFQFATENVHRYEQEVRNLIPQIRGLRNGITQMGDVLAPQGHAFENYVKSLMQANPELALMNKLFKTGNWVWSERNAVLTQATANTQKNTAEIEKQTAAEQKYSEAVQNAAQALRSQFNTGKASYIDVGGKAIYADESKASIEYQINQLVKERGKDFNLQHAVAQAIEQDENRISENLRKQVDAEKQINEEKTKRVKTFTVELESLNTLNEKAKKLRSMLADMTNTQLRDPKNGGALSRRLREIEAQIKKVKQEIDRPTKEEVFGIKPKTLDDMANKLRMLQSYKMGINLNAPQAANEIKQVDDAINRLKKDMDKYMSTGREVNSMNNALARSFNYMKNRLAFYFTVGASTQFVKNLIDIRSQYEMNERALGILINSAERGSQIFKELSNMALVSPYTLIELSTAAKQLVAYDIAARDVVDTTRRLADMTAAVGIPIERLTYALGQIKAYGYLNARDARMFSNAGIPLVKELADYYSQLEGRMVSVADVYDRIKKKAIDYNSVMNVISKMTDEGGRFFDFQAKMADTLKVKLANLTLAWNNMLNDIGKSEQGLLTWTIGALKEVFLQWKNINRVVEDLIIIFGVLKSVQLVYYGVMLGTSKAITAQAVLGKKLTSILKTLGGTMNQVLTSGATWWGLLGAAAIGAAISIVRGNEAMKEFNKSIREDAKNTYNDVTKFLEQYKELKNSLYDVEKKTRFVPYSDGYEKEESYDVLVGKDIKKEDALKAWAAIREQIELSSQASSDFIGKLLSIENTSERVRQGFKVLEDIQTVTAALNELGDDGIKVSREWSEWWNLWTLPDGVIGNLKDAHLWISKITDEFGSLENARKVAATSTTEEGLPNLFQKRADDYIKNYENELEKFRKDLSETTQSVINFIELKGWNGDTNKIEEAFSRVFKNLAASNNLSPKELMTMRLESAQAEYDALEKALESHIVDENAALEKARDDNEKADIESRLKVYQDDLSFLKDNTAQSRIYWEDFTKWMGQQHKSEVQTMFRNQTSEQIKMLDFSKGEYNKWVVELAQKYAKEHGMAYADVYEQLKNYITNANQWSIRIPLIISTEDSKTALQTLKDADTAYDTAEAAINRLKKRQKELVDSGANKLKETKDQTDADRELIMVEDELAEHEKALADAKAKGGHGKKEDANARKAQKQTESDLQRVLKEEIQLIDKARSSYKTLTKEGVDSQTAIAQATSGFDKTLKDINSVLIKNGLKVFDITKYAGVENPREILNLLEAQLNQLMTAGNAKPAEIEALEIKIRDLKIDAATFDQKKFVSSLNNELSKIKEEYELAIDLDANPELGNVFADLMGISEEQLQDLPRNFDSVLKKMQAKIDTILGSEKKFDLAANLNKKVFEQWIDANGMLLDSDKAKALKAYVDAANKIRQDETKKQIDEWNKLLEKYAEYEYKRKTIMETAERERKIAIQKGASQEIITAINNRERQDLAKLDFEEFQKTPEWIVATGDLANMSKSAIGLLIRQIEEYKRTARDLSPKQIKQLNNALSKLYKEQRKNNPFKAISNMLQEARDRMATFDEDIKKVQKEIDDLTKKKKANIVYGVADEDVDNALKKAIKRFNELKKAQKEAGKVDASGWVAAINETTAAVKSAVMVFDDLINAISGVSESDIGKAFSVIEKAGSTAAIGAQIGGVWGAVAGGLIGAVSGFISTFGDELSGNASITKSVKESENAVKRLEIAYVDLQRAIDKAYGSEVVGAKQAMAAAKEKELEELEKQLELERSRESKNRDEDKILELKKSIKELRYEIKDTIEDITNDLMGTDAYSFAERLVSSMIDAFKKGEDYMKVFEESFDSMVDNMIMKAIVSRVVGLYLDKIWESVEDNIQARSKKESDEYGRLKSRLEELESMDYYEYAQSYGTYNTPKSSSSIAAWEKKRQEEIERTKKELDAAKANYDAVSQLNNEDISSLIQQLAELKPELAERLKELLGQWYTFGSDNDSALSALQQGIQGITEDTAGALEAYMNGVSQQVYLHSEYLRQIVEFLSTSNGELEDVKVATLSQMLLQLQNCYQIMQSMHNMMDNWQVASGNGIRVELIS